MSRTVGSGSTHSRFCASSGQLGSTPVQSRPEGNESTVDLRALCSVERSCRCDEHDVVSEGADLTPGCCGAPGLRSHTPSTRPGRHGPGVSPSGPAQGTTGQRGSRGSQTDGPRKPCAVHNTVVRTGRTNDLDRRRGEHARDSRFKGLRFETIWMRTRNRPCYRTRSLSARSF
jgi:hypothetical protein